MTPEGKVKELVKRRLKALGCIPAHAARTDGDVKGWYYMPIGGAYAVAGVPDFIGHYKGRFFAIETKAEKKEPTALQKKQLNAINASGGVAVVVRCEEDFEEFEEIINGNPERQY